jgi:hypothetical protein
MDTIGRVTYAARIMKAIRLVHQGHPLELHDVPMPQPGAHDVLIRVKAAGICHSDAHYLAFIPCPSRSAMKSLAQSNRSDAM